ncbi:MAG TPA: DUF5691 domain-containing protein [Ktedonobacteraceae bacterium]|nr:DUF5691 domain-containing protein [Ktedonobacteraceae bacterium]
MDPIVTTALVGTARQGSVNPATGTPVDALIEGLSESEAERRLLLSAGAWAIYRQAGQQPQRIAAIPEPARPETLRACTPEATLLLSRLLNGEQADLLPEALTLLGRAGKYLPYHLLPVMLSKTGKELRASLFPVLGERGLWLSQFNSAWHWVQNYLPAASNALPVDAETIWQEGSVGQRVEVLRRLRAVDPAKAREWLEAVWKQERAEVRGDLLNALEVGLGAADEALLEKALDDRAASVRLIAASLLTRIPTSAFVERMCTRGGSMVKNVKGRLVISPPTAFAKEWLRDGVTEKPPGKLGERSWWLIQILSAIPPTFWETHLEAGPTELLELLAGTRWQVNIIDGWSRATVTYSAPAWVMPLWLWWQEHYGKHAGKAISDYTVREQLLKCLPQREAEQIVLTLLRANQSDRENDWQTFLPELPQPWSEEFGRACLHVFYDYCETRLGEKTGVNPYSDIWLNSLPTLARALPESCLATALSSWKPANLPEEKQTWQVEYTRQVLEKFIETVQMRQKIYKEIV